MTTTISDIVSARNLASLSRDLRSQSLTAQRELTTGRRADLAESTNGRIGDIQLLQQSIDALARRKDGLNLAASEGAVRQISLNALAGSLGDLSVRTAGAAANNDGPGLALAANDARAAIETAFSNLNARANGRYVFSGDAVTQPPFAAASQFLTDINAIAAAATDSADLETRLDDYFNNPAGGFQTTIYRGGTGAAPDIEIAPGERIGFSVRGDDTALKDVLRGLAGIVAVVDGGFTGDRARAAADATGVLANADTGLVNLRANIGVTERRIEAVSIRLEAEESTLTQLYNDRTARDPFEAATTLRELETRLQASFVTTARISNLTLANFLR